MRRAHYITALAEGCQHPVMDDGTGQHLPGCGDLEMTTGTEIDTQRWMAGQVCLVHCQVESNSSSKRHIRLAIDLAFEK